MFVVDYYCVPLAVVQGASFQVLTVLGHSDACAGVSGAICSGDHTAIFSQRPLFYPILGSEISASSLSETTGLLRGL